MIDATQCTALIISVSETRINNTHKNNMIYSKLTFVRRTKTSNKYHQRMTPGQFYPDDSF